MKPVMITRLKQSRLDKQLKQSDVALNLNVKSNTISNWENGKSNPDIDTLFLLCEIYGISCIDLLEEAYESERSRPISVTKAERDMIAAFRNADTLEKAMLFRILGLDKV